MGIRVVLFAVIANLAAVASAQAATFTYQYEATLTFTSTGITGLSFGQSVTGTFTYSDDYPVNATGIAQTVYDATSTGMLTMEGVGSPSPIDRLFVENNLVIGSPVDRFSLFSADGVTNIGLQDSTAAVFSDTSIPTSLSLGDFTVGSVSFAFSSGSPFGEGRVVANVTSLELVPMAEIPLPAAFPLFLAGLAGLGLAGRRRRAQR